MDATGSGAFQSISALRVIDLDVRCPVRSFRHLNYGGPICDWDPYRRKLVEALKHGHTWSGVAYGLGGDHPLVLAVLELYARGPRDERDPAVWSEAHKSSNPHFCVNIDAQDSLPVIEVEVLEESGEAVATVPYRPMAIVNHDDIRGHVPRYITRINQDVRVDYVIEAPFGQVPPGDSDDEDGLKRPSFAITDLMSCETRSCRCGRRVCEHVQWSAVRLPFAPPHFSGISGPRSAVYDGSSDFLSAVRDNPTSDDDIIRDTVDVDRMLAQACASRTTLE